MTAARPLAAAFAAAMVLAVAVPPQAGAAAPVGCPSGVSDASLWGYVAGSGSYQEPDEEVTDPPAPVAEALRQRAFETGGPEPHVAELRAGWHGVSALHHGPLGVYLLCKYAGRPDLRVPVPEGLDACTYTPGKAYCQ